MSFVETMGIFVETSMPKPSIFGHDWLERHGGSLVAGKSPDKMGMKNRQKSSMGDL